MADGEVIPCWLGERDRPWLRDLLESALGFVGRTAAELRQYWGREPDPRAGQRHWPARHVISSWLARSSHAPRRTSWRRRLFALRAAGSSREDALAVVAAENGIDAELLARSLFDDLPDRRLVSRPDTLDPGVLAVVANSCMVRTLLRHASKAELRSRGGSRLLWRTAWLLGVALEHVADGGATLARWRRGPTGLATGPTTGLAALAPLLPWLHRYRLTAELQHPIARGHLVLATGDPLQPGPEPTAYDSRLERRFAADLRRLHPTWQLLREPEPVRTSSGLAFPDFAITGPGRPTWLCEIAGLRQLSCLPAKLALLEHPRVVLCLPERHVPERLRGHPRIVPFQGHVPVPRVVAAITAPFLAPDTRASLFAPESRNCMSFTHQGRTIRKVAVIGSGQIGPDIALYFTKVLSPFGVETVVVDVSEDALAGGRKKLEKKVAKGVESGAFSAEQQTKMTGSVTWTSNYDAIKGADLVVEAATENKELKGKIFGQVEGLVQDDAILVSNSSHLEPEVIFANAKLKGRTGVVHYFFPAERNLLVEVVPGKDTAAATTKWLLSFYEEIGKVPIEVQSRYGYALDPVFEGLFYACALLAEEGVATTKQIDVVCKKTFKMGVGSFTAMNLTGGNPITAVGLDNYTTKIGPYFKTPQSLKDKVAQKANWDVPARGEQVDVPDDVAAKVRDELLGAYFGLCGEIVDAGLVTIADFNMGIEVALDMKPAFSFMNELGTAKALALVEAYAKKHQGFPVAKCIAAHGAENKPFDIPVVLREDRDGIAVLTIRRPKVLNALDQGVFAEIQRRFEECQKDPKVVGVVLTGFGKKAFVSGADVNFLAKIDSVQMGEQTSRTSQKCVDAVQAVTKPTVAALNGLAFGGGIETAMACETRIARKGLKVLAGQPEANLGIIPGAGGTVRLARIVGIERANEMLRTCRPISSEKALAYGLIREEVDGDLVGRAVQLAKEMAEGKAPRSRMAEGPMADVPSTLPAVEIGHLSKKVDEILQKAILGAAKLPLAEAIPFEAKCFGEVCGTEDMKIGVTNFMKNGPKVKAEFVHR
ncbi:MAG: enoyl-CoA hydratase/isomerase family protein [Planctomycetes bacterium]|nr:enoyl-CoA hydratase/isomerase family protein [Planctomycetota bacterium]